MLLHMTPHHVFTCLEYFVPVCHFSCMWIFCLLTVLITSLLVAFASSSFSVRTFCIVLQFIILQVSYKEIIAEGQLPVNTVYQLLIPHIVQGCKPYLIGRIAASTMIQLTGSGKDTAFLARYNMCFFFFFFSLYLQKCWLPEK